LFYSLSVIGPIGYWYYDVMLNRSLRCMAKPYTMAVDSFFDGFLCKYVWQLLSGADSAEITADRAGSESDAENGEVNGGNINRFSIRTTLA